MDAVYQWIQGHQLIVGFATPIILGLLALVFTPGKFIKWGFLFSQWVRHFAGPKFEKALEDDLTEFLQGMKSDNQSMQPPAGGAALLLFGFLFLSFSSAQATEIFNRPMNYFLTPRTIATGYTMPDSAFWVLKPTVTVPILQLKPSQKPGTKLDVSTMASAGGGLTYERDVVLNGKNYSTMSISVLEMLATNPPGLNPDFAAGIVGGMFNNLIQAGVGYDFGSVPSGSRWFLMLGFGINLVQN